jgi:hypothetical protein
MTELLFTLDIVKKPAINLNNSLFSFLQVESVLWLVFLLNRQLCQYVLFALTQRDVKSFLTVLFSTNIFHL